MTSKESSGVASFKEAVYRSLDASAVATGKVEERVRALEIALAVANSRGAVYGALAGAIAAAVLTGAVAWAFKRL